MVTSCPGKSLFGADMARHVIARIPRDMPHSSFGDDGKIASTKPFLKTQFHPSKTPQAAAESYIRRLSNVGKATIFKCWETGCLGKTKTGSVTENITSVIWNKGTVFQYTLVFAFRQPCEIMITV
ncbi:hypothetical protein QYF36_023049 [Acer negundo]|nr:hypothetical protein QYF36_023049 [Acer negundo]